MSIVVGANVIIRPFSGFRDPSLPTGYWVGNGTVTGDGSGGTMAVDLRFQFTDGPRMSSFFSLEQFYVTSTDNVAQNVRLSTFNMDRLSPSLLPNPRWSVPLLPTDVNIDNASSEVNGRLGIFLGSPSNAEVTSIIQAIANEVSATLLTLGAQGYVWGPRAILTEGGLQRPAQGLYT